MTDQLSPGQRMNTTFQELADELGRTRQSMHHLCEAQQVYVRGPDTEISPSNADRLREAHGDYLRRRDIMRTTAVRTGARNQQRDTPSDFEAAVYKQWPGTIPVRAIALQWAEQLFDISEATAWWAAGLRSGDAALAAVLRELGIRPKHLAVTVRGDTILFRLIDQNMAPERVVRVLREAGHLHADDQPTP